MILLLFLFCSRATRVLAGIEKWHHGFRGEFSVVNKGRMPFHTVLMFLNDVDISECINMCIKHRQCRSVSYEKSLKECELNDLEFDNIEAQQQAGWINYSSPPMVHGGFSDWVWTACSKSCGEGTKLYYRLCDNPRPKFGGDGCEGDYQKVLQCNLGPCDNLALGKPSYLSGDYNRAKRPELTANFGNDGNLTTKAVSNNVKLDTNWYVKLESPIKIRLIRLHLHGYAISQSYYKNLAVQTRNTNSAWQLCRKIEKPEELIVNVTCEKETIADSVRIILLKTKSFLYLREVEVYMK